jgi:hypothetical protein
MVDEGIYRSLVAEIAERSGGAVPLLRLIKHCHQYR